jgi:hypothetical protein
MGFPAAFLFCLKGKIKDRREPKLRGDFFERRCNGINHEYHDPLLLFIAYSSCS